MEEASGGEKEKKGNTGEDRGEGRRGEIDAGGGWDHEERTHVEYQLELEQQCVW